MNPLEWCERQGVAFEHFLVTRILLRRLSEPEAASQFVCAKLGQDPRGVQGFETIKMLWSSDDPPTFRDDDLEIFEALQGGEVQG